MKTFFYIIILFASLLLSGCFPKGEIDFARHTVDRSMNLAHDSVNQSMNLANSYKNSYPSNDTTAQPQYDNVSEDN